MRLGSLFSGLGTAEIATKAVFDDARCVFACEIDKYARASFEANVSCEEFYKDIRDIDGSKYKDKIDILIGGSPCQDFSLAGLRAGIAGERGQLLYEYLRVLKEARPKYFIFENVKGLLSINKGKTFNTLLEYVKELGYFLTYQILNTKDYGIPQNRERLYLVGSKEDLGISFKKPVKLTKSIKDFLDTDNNKYLNKPYELLPKPIGSSIIQVAKTDCSRANMRRVYSVEGASPCLLAVAGTGGNNQVKVLIRDKIRVLSPREYLRLQGFDDSYKIVVSNSQMYKQAGNAMSLNVLTMVLESIKEAHKGV
jgi:DNA (cytosine-5-)-methyltransferase